MVLSSADTFFFIISFFVVLFSKKKSVISVECQAVWIQIMPVGSDLGPKLFAKVISRRH